MKEDTCFYGVFDGDHLVAASSSELDHDASTVEFTDFVTLPSHRGDNLSYILLRQMESDMKKMKMTTGYTIARSLSFGMNITFCHRGYTYAGTLVNNTCISGNIQSMNVYYKHFIE
jgi:putative beta-lysine N-acetyltransferase